MNWSFPKRPSAGPKQPAHFFRQQLGVPKRQQDEADSTRVHSSGSLDEKFLKAVGEKGLRMFLIGTRTTRLACWLDPTGFLTFLCFSKHLSTPGSKRRPAIPMFKCCATV
jgi:hypothetical protein